MEPGPQGGDGRRGVQMIGGDDHQHIHAAPFARQQCAKIVISAVRGQAKGGGAAPSLRRVPAEGAAHQLELPVQRGGGAMDGADEGALRAADHAVSYLHGRTWILMLRKATPSPWS